MAILSNINGKFAVESSGAIQLSGSAGTSGYVLKSNGTGSAASWVDPTTIIGGPYLPLSGGTLTGATATASNIAFTVGGTLTVSGSGGSVFNSTGASNHIVAAYRATNGNNVTTFRTTDSGYIFRIHAQNSGTIYVQNDDGSNYLKIPDSGSNEVSGDTTFLNAVDIVGGSAYPLQVTSTQRYMVQIRNLNNTVSSNYGWWWFMDTNFNMGFHADGASDRFTLTRDGNASFSGTGAFGSNISAPVVQANVLNNQANSANIIYRSGTTTIIGGGSSSNKLYVLDNGDVGVNVASPIAKLQVDGNIALHASSNAPYIDFVENGATSDSKARITMDQIDTNNGELIFSTEGSGTLSTALTLDSNQNTIVSGPFWIQEYIYHHGDADTYIRALPDEWVLRTGGSDRLTISNSNTYFTNTNVGIGTSNPSHNLEISGVGGDGTPLLQFTGSASATYNWISSAMHANLASGETSVHLFGQAESSKNSGYIGYLYSSSGSNNNAVTIGHYAANHLVNILASGAVGIGTSSPAVHLHVKANTTTSSGETIRMQGAYATGRNYLQFADSGGNIDAYIGLGSSSDDRFLIVNFTDEPTYFYNKNSIKMTITNVGNVGIATTSPNEKLTVAGNVNITGTGALLRWNSGDFQIRNAGSYAMAFDTYSGSALVERMRIVSGGYIGMNTSPSGFATLEIENIASTTYGLYVDYIDTNASYGAMKVILTGASTSPSYVDWWYGATQTGAVVTTGSSTQYLTSSDYRLKENIVPMSNAIDRIKQLKPSRFNFIGHENTVDGLIAHEVAEIVPEAVNGEKDGLRDDGTPKYQGIDEGKLVPLLIGAIQELEARVKELENK